MDLRRSFFRVLSEKRDSILFENGILSAVDYNWQISEKYDYHTGIDMCSMKFISLRVQ